MNSGWLMTSQSFWDTIRTSFHLSVALGSRNCIMYNACISACEEAGEWQRVLRLLLDAQDGLFYVDCGYQKMEKHR